MPVDGVHDLGGMQGFGPIEPEADEPVFHADWERRAFRLTISCLLTGHLNGRFRHAIERMDPAWYLASPYYEHWLTATATGLVVRLDGMFSVPDVEYHCDRQRSEPTYSVRFEAIDLWGTAGDPVHVDLWECYIFDPTEESAHE